MGDRGGIARDPAACQEWADAYAAYCEADPTDLSPKDLEAFADAAWWTSRLEDSAAYARFFNPTVGIVEDPATGSAAGPLASQLVTRGVVADEKTMIIEQGYAMGRASRIRVTVLGAQVRVGGTGIVVAEGQLHI